MNTLAANGRVVVVGAGPAGTSMAIYLAGQGHDVTIFESRPDMRRRDISAGRSINLALATRGIAVLRDLGVDEAVSAITIAMRGRMVHADGNLNLQPYGIRPDDAIMSVSRRDLNSILLDAAEATGRVRIEFETRCRRVDLERRVMHLTDQTGHASEVEFGVVFGADGSASAVRDAMVDAGSTRVAIAELGHGYKELTVAPSSAGGFQLDPHALHIWPRGEFMLIALANPSGDFTTTLFMPNRSDSGDSFANVRSGVDGVKFFNQEFPDFVPLVPDLETQYASNPVGQLSTVRTSGWSHGDAAVLVGDAAHAIVPFHGQGMNAAMESCRVLNSHLRNHVDDAAAAFRAFENERRPDTDAIADMALDNYIEMRASVVDPEYLLQRALALELERRWPQRVRSRYCMVMFTTIGYGEARRRAGKLAAVLDELTGGIAHISEVDFSRAAELVASLGTLPSVAEEPT